jgi:hypothetical protein
MAKVRDKATPAHSNPEIAKMRDTLAEAEGVVKDSSKRANLKARWLYYGYNPTARQDRVGDREAEVEKSFGPTDQRMPAPKSINRAATQEDGVYNILAELDKAGRLEPREVRKIVEPKYLMKKYRGMKKASPRTIQRVYGRYVEEHSLK